MLFTLFSLQDADMARSQSKGSVCFGPAQKQGRRQPPWPNG